MCLIMTEEGWKQLSPVCVNHNDLKGVYRPDTVEGARAVTAAQAKQFCEVLEEGDMIRIKSFYFPMHGPFGERL